MLLVKKMAVFIMEDALSVWTNLAPTGCLRLKQRRGSLRLMHEWLKIFAPFSSNQHQNPITTRFDLSISLPDWLILPLSLGLISKTWCHGLGLVEINVNNMGNYSR